jgi:valyl-tRNA synthetase
MRTNALCRYAHLHGQHEVHPLDGRKIPIITDAELVDMSFGTGAVKITPAHDPNDFATGKRHNLQFLNILTNEGNINVAGGQFAGQPRFKVSFKNTVCIFSGSTCLSSPAQLRECMGPCSEIGCSKCHRACLND